VIIAIYIGNIRKSSDSINQVQDPYAQQARDTAWCSSVFIFGKDCVDEGATTCRDVEIDGKKCQNAEPKQDAKTKQFSYNCGNRFP